MSVIPCLQNEELQKLILDYAEVLKTDAHIPDYSYLDLSATWRIRDHFGLRAGRHAQNQ